MSEDVKNPQSKKVGRRPLTVQHRTVRIFFLIVMLGAGYLFLQLFLPYLTAIILAVVLSSLFHPVYDRLRKTFRGKKAPAAALVCVLVVLLVVLPLAGFLGLLTKEAIEFLGRLSVYLSVDDVNTLLAGEGLAADLYAWLNDQFGIVVDPEQVRETIISNGKRAGVVLASSGRVIAGSIFGVIVQFLLMIFTMYYLFRDGKDLVAYLMDLSPLPDTQERQIIQRFRDVGGAVFYGNIVSSVLQGIFGGLGFLFFGIPGAFLWGSVMGILALIPLLGTMLVFIPASIVLMVQGQWGLAIGFLIYNLIASNVLDNWLKPKLIEKRLRAHPLLVFFSIIGGISAFGILGILYGPLIMTIFLALVEIYKRDFRDPRLSSAAEATTEGTHDDRVLG